MSNRSATRFRHQKWGMCELVRVEAADWIVRVESIGLPFRIPPERRSEFELVDDGSQELNSLDSSPPSRAPPVAQAIRTQQTAANGVSVGSRGAKRALESLRNGLPPPDGCTRKLAVGLGQIDNAINSFLGAVDSEGGRVIVLRGAYGQGKTFALTVLEESALDAGFVTVRTEIDASENQLHKPYNVYRDLMEHLRFPGADERGVRAFVSNASQVLSSIAPQGNLLSRQIWLNAKIGCPPLGWLFSDPGVANKPGLVALFGADPNIRVGEARNSHVDPPFPRTWPAFNAGTQGDYASFLLSGLGRLSRLLGFKGLIVMLDEMEKWAQLDWYQQSRAGNLLGGLIWGATAPLGSRARDDHPVVLHHSGRCGGFPFTTVDRNHVGVAIAMTPRNEQLSPETTWARYGPFDTLDIPTMSVEDIPRYCRRVIPQFIEAYGITSPSAEEFDEITAEATRQWRQTGVMTTRSIVQAVVTALDGWREWRESH